MTDRKSRTSFSLTEIFKAVTLSAGICFCLTANLSTLAAVFGLIALTLISYGRKVKKTIVFAVMFYWFTLTLIMLLAFTFKFNISWTSLNPFKISTVVSCLVFAGMSIFRSEILVAEPSVRTNGSGLDSEPTPKRDIVKNGEPCEPLL